MRSIEHFINGQRVAGSSGRHGEVFDPNSGQVQARVALAGADELEHAVATAAAAQADWAKVKSFAQGIARAMTKDSPQKYVAVATKAARRRRIFVDYLRNGRGATAVVAYSTRARPGATVSTPIAWDELGPGMRPDRFTATNLLHRLAHLKDPWKGVRERARPLPA